MNEKQMEVLGDAIMLYGEKAQMDMCIEECSELIEAICKYKRDPCDETIAGMTDETADVSIMVLQMVIMLGADKVDERMKFKIERLRMRMEEEE